MQMRLCNIANRGPTIQARFFRCTSNLFWFPGSRGYSGRSSNKDYAKARKWFDTFSESSLPKDLGAVSYSRSSGPGGQNVNKVNTKAQLRVSLDQLLPLVPPVLHDGVKSSRFYAEKTESLLFQADDSRKQSANKDSCYRKMNEMLLDIYKSTVPGETSEEQKEKVRNMKELDNEARLMNKKKKSDKKAARSKTFND